MSGADIPSVPVTTLAGLTSISDLLSELPLSDTQSQNALNKSLLFHPRVAEEAKNLLASVQDDQRVQQLVTAIEQTNSDQIVLKEKFQNLTVNQGFNEGQQSVPELLQAILRKKSNVFDTRSSVPSQIPQQQQQHHHPQSHHHQQQQQPGSMHAPNQQHQNQFENYQQFQSQNEGFQYQSQQQFDPYSQQQQQQNYYNNPGFGGSGQFTNNLIQSAGNQGQQNWNQQQQNFPQQQQPVQPGANFSTSSDPMQFQQQQNQQPAQQQSFQQFTVNQQQQQRQQNSVSLDSQIHQQSQGQQQSSQQQQQNPQQMSQFSQVLAAAAAAAYQNAGVIKELNAQPRNNEYLEQQQQNKNFDLKSQSPAQAMDVIGESSKKTPLPQTIKLEGDIERITSDLGFKTPKVCLNRLSKENELLMQESLSKFANKEPELAKQMGIGETEKSSEENDSLFTRMKASERKRRPGTEVKKEDEQEPFSQPKLRRIEKKVVPTIKKMSKEELLSSNTYQQFMTTLEKIFEQLDETENEMIANIEDGDDNECISTNLLHGISSEAAKLKAKGTIDLVPNNKLTLLITYAMRSVNSAQNCCAGPDMIEEVIASDYVEKIINAIEASLLVANIYSCCNVQFLQEDNLDTIIKFLQFQLRETVFPSFDPVYAVETKKKGGEGGKKGKGKQATGQVRGVNTIYSKIVDLTKVLVTIFQKFQFVDTIVIHASAIGVEPFFVDNIDTLQFVCLDLVTTIFQNEKYSKHRSNILADILTSLDRLHSSKKMLRPYKLANNGGSIQMVTALVLQLIQCSVVLPETLYEEPANNTSSNNHHNHSKKKNSSNSHNHHVNNNNSSSNEKKEEKEGKVKVDKDIFINEKYETAISIGANFLQTFLSKCKPRSGETDFRPLFENFIHDLLTTVNKPEWPASELLLTLLGTLLVKNMSDKSVEQSIRVVSLEYLGIVAARLRKDTVESRCKVSTMDQLIKYIKIEQEKEGDLEVNDSIAELNPDEERAEFLQKILLDFLAVNAQEENIVWEHSRHFYLTQWYRDILKRKKMIAEGTNKSYASRKKTPKKRKKLKNESESESSEAGSEDSDLDDEMDGTTNNSSSKKGKGGGAAVDQELNLEIFRILEKRKRFLLSNIRLTNSKNVHHLDVKTYIDYGNAHLIAQYLSSKRSFSQSFDTFLNKIIWVMWEQSIAIRTKAMKCLTNIVEVDPSILKRKDMKIGVSQKFLDQSISVREAAVDLIGKYVLTSPDLINQYYQMLSERILDTGVSVRKRVIKILRDICIEYPDFERIPEICVKMIRRVNDEESIQKLVTEVFLEMWFNPVENDNKLMISRKITQITDVVSCSNENTQWLDGLLKSIFKPKENKEDATKVVKEPPKQIIWACEQVVNCLVETIVQLEGTDNRKLLGCITTLHLFAKIRPQLIVRHAITLEPYLNIKCHSNYVVRFMSCVAEILEHVVPLMEHPSESFLYDLENHLMMLVVAQNQTVVHSCISCLGAIVNKLTKNFKLIRDCFKKFYSSLTQCKEKLIQEPNYPLELIYKSMFRRSIFTVGLLTRYFDFTLPPVYGENLADGLSPKICDEIFDTFIFFVTCSNLDIRRITLQAIGHFCVKNFEYLTLPQLKDFYRELLTSDLVQNDIKVCVIKNILIYLNEEDQRMFENEKHWLEQSKSEDLKEMGDKMAGMASRVIQLYLKEILNCFLSQDFNVRLWAMKVVEAVLTQGLVHPVQIVPYLICLSTDPETQVSHSADKHLQDIEKQYPGFINMKTNAGIHLSFDLQMLLQMSEKNKLVRGYRVKNPDEPPSALTGFLYSLLRNAKPTRRAVVQQIIKQFDDQNINLRLLLYLADNLAYLPYLVQDEPLYIIHQIDVLVTVTGTNLMVTFREGLKPNPNSDPSAAANQIQQQGALQNANNPGNALHAVLLDDEDDDDIDTLLERLPEDTTELQKCIRSSQGCVLLLLLKQHLKEIYGFTDSKISRYSPSEPAKVYEKSMQRRATANFNPKATMELIETEEDNQIGADQQLNDEEKRLLIDRYLDFKQLMMKLDPEDSDAEDEEGKSSLQNTPSKQSTAAAAPLPQIDFESSIDNLSGGGGGGAVPMNNSSNVLPVNIPTNCTNVAAFVQQQQMSTPSRGRGNNATTKSPKKQQPARKATTRRRKKISSSEEEESDYNSDSDY